MKRRFVISAAATLAIVALGWLEVRDLRERGELEAAISVVKELGGDVGFLTSPFPFSGIEFRMHFKGNHVPVEQLTRLVVLNSLTRDSVGIMFEDTNVTEGDVRRLRELLPKSRVFRVVKGTIVHDD